MATAAERPQPSWLLADWLRYQECLNPREIELGLDRIRAVADRLGLLAPVALTLTVAGTNGKGSSVALLTEIHRAAGRRVGRYTSPHLWRYNERIAIDNVDIDDAALCRAFQRIESARGAIPLTYFEFGTLAALLCFRDADVDVQVLEVGLGGRLDAVNIIDADGALITQIGLDHLDWLGPDRESIGREKAGVLRRGRPGVCADPSPPDSIAAIASALGLPLRQAGRDFDFRVHADGCWDWRGATMTLRDLPAPALPGAFQYRNASGVLALVEALRARLPVDEGAIRLALPAFRVPARCQRIGDVILDVAHNAEAAQALADYLRDAGLAGRVRLVFGMLADKPIEGTVEVLATITRAAYLTGLPGSRGLDAASFASRAAALPVISRHDDPAAALAAARRDLERGEVIVVCGSFLTVAAVGSILRQEATETGDARKAACAS